MDARKHRILGFYLIFENLPKKAKCSNSFWFFRLLSPSSVMGYPNLQDLKFYNKSPDLEIFGFFTIFAVFAHCKTWTKASQVRTTARYEENNSRNGKSAKNAPKRRVRNFFCAMQKFLRHGTLRKSKLEMHQKNLIHPELFAGPLFNPHRLFFLCPIRGKQQQKWKEREKCA